MRSNVSVESSVVNVVTYEVVHLTQYEYSEAVSVSHYIARLNPRTLAYQRCLHHELQIDPQPDTTTTHVDYFGNSMTFFAMHVAHRRLTVRARSQIALSPVSVPEPSATPPWEQALDHRTLPLDAVECGFDSAEIRPSGELAGYARSSFPAGRPMLEAVMDLTGRIHDEFAFDPAATTVATSLAQVFQSRRGVCQDFARLEIACLRALGLPARYVSGYLETLPPPGRPRLLGADASHAWLAVYCPGIGWIDVDPTNNLLPSGTHITLGWGRDYEDVSPVRGIILGGGEHSLQVSVDVMRLENMADG